MKKGIFLIIIFFFPSITRAEVTCWTESATVKIRPFATAGSSQSVTLKAAKNEYESFQIAVSSTTPVTITSVSATELTGTSGTISESNIKIFREAYINITTPSNLEGTQGLWPDALIPDKDVYFNEIRSAFPVVLPGGQNQAFWVDVFIPQNANSGLYTGSLSITIKGHPQIEIPISLTVWAFSVPSTSTLATSFGFDGWDFQQGHFGDSNHTEQIVPLSQLYAKAALMNRITLSSVTKEDWSILWPPPPNIDWSEFDNNWGPFLVGINLPYGLQNARFTSLEIGDSGDSDAERIAFWQAYASHFKSNEWFHLLFDYTWDEPSDEWDFDQLKKRATLIHQANPDLRTLVTTDIQQGEQNSLNGYIDIWVPVINFMDDKTGGICWDSTYAGNQRGFYDPFIAAGDELWWYQSCMSHGCGTDDSASECFSGWPSLMIDIPAIYNRIMEWASFKYSISGELYFETVWAYKGITGQNDPWNNQYYFWGNGDGTLFYPGRPDKIGGTHHIPIESIRLKMIREGMEDYEYMKLLQQLGEEIYVRQQVDQVTTNAYTFTHDPAVLYNSRENMAQRILSANIAGADGDVAPLGSRDGIVNVGDALVALRFALGSETPIPEDIAHGDVAPLDDQGQPNPDGFINVGDALVILRKALGLISF